MVFVERSCPTFGGITFDSVELQKWSCTLEKPQNIFKRLVIHLNRARMAQFGLRGYFLKSSQANFCQIRYSSCVIHCHIHKNDNKYDNNNKNQYSSVNRLLIVQAKMIALSETKACFVFQMLGHHLMYISGCSCIAWSFMNNQKNSLALLQLQPQLLLM